MLEQLYCRDGGVVLYLELILMLDLTNHHAKGRVHQATSLMSLERRRIKFSLQFK